MRNTCLIMLVCCVACSAVAQQSAYDSIPVRISTLSALSTGKDARLDWKVVCFLDYAKFDIQRSVNGISFITIYSFEADRLRCSQPFDFTDVNITGKFFYRLRAGDLDGHYYQSQIVTASGKQNVFQINSLKPNIVSSFAALSISSAEQDRATIIVRNFQGIVVKRLAADLNKGITELVLDLSLLARGHYLVSVSNTNSNIQSARLLKQ